MLHRRFSEESVRTALHDTRVVAVQGARQTGKTTLVKAIASECNARYITLDDLTQREVAIHDPKLFAEQATDKLLVIDEVQRSPALILAIKEVVDNNLRPGQFLLTGSRDLANDASLEDSLAGRVEIIDLFGLSMLERNLGNKLFLEAMFTKKPMDVLSEIKYSLARQDYLNLTLEGGYPEAIARSDKARRDKWFDNYTRQLLRKDVGEANQLRRAHILPKLLKYLASISGKPAVMANIARDISEPRSTIEEYVSLLESVFLIDKIPAWSSNATTRATKHPKLMFRDSGLLCRQLGVGKGFATDLASSMSGMAFETFIYGELSKLLSTGQEEYTVYQYRDSQKKEVDLVVQDGDGVLALIEVKLSSSVGVRDFQNMEFLRSKSSNIRNCFVIYTGQNGLAFSDHSYAVPAQALWA